MRAAVLHLAFAGLGALRAETEAFEDNAASRRVTESLGYRPDGDGIVLRRGVADRVERFALDRAEWERRRRDDVAVEGLDAALGMFGLA